MEECVCICDESKPKCIEECINPLMQLVDTVIVLEEL
jgi:hypothetical protein